MQKEFYYMICSIALVYLGIFVYLKFLLRYKLTDVGIEISFLGVEQEFVRFDDIVGIGLNFKLDDKFQNSTKFLGTSLPISRILIIVNRNHDYGFGQIYTGFSIYPWNAKDFCHQISLKIGDRNGKV